MKVLKKAWQTINDFMDRRIFGVRAWVFCLAAVLGGVAPDFGHAANLLTNGAVDWGWFHNNTAFFSGVFITSVVGFMATIRLGGKIKREV